MDRLAEAWREVEDRYGFPFESPDISARAVMGMALVLALESHRPVALRRIPRGVPGRAIALSAQSAPEPVLP
jgi:hypothetical protein